MELMGQWSPNVQADESESGEGLGDNLGLFTFPMVEGGAGLETEIFGGGDSYAVGRDAPPEAVEFLKWLVTDPANVEKWAAPSLGTLPTAVGAEAYVTDPSMQSILQALGAATYTQLYLDQATPPAVAGAINEAVNGIVAGVLSPEDVVAAITEAAAAEA
jgi:raffinose/stachyose/melibiose transport system substrate-binding protein